jgi:hypothetical protein
MEWTRMSIDFTNPIALLLLGLIPLAIFLARRSLAGLAGGRAVIVSSVRITVILGIVLALSGVRLTSTSQDLALIFLIDVSASVPSEQRDVALEFINREIERTSERDFIGVIAFAREASVELAPTRKEALGQWRLTEISSNPARDRTNFADAFRLATALVPETAVGRFILISDGNENLKKALEETPLLKASGIEVFTAQAGPEQNSSLQPEIAVRSLDAPERLSEAETFDLRIAIDSAADVRARLRVLRNDSIVAERDVELTGGGENIFVIPQRLEQNGLYTYRAEVESDSPDRFVQNNSLEAFSTVPGLCTCTAIRSLPRVLPES